jgi:26S proteasome non-ATPase regulatory subunit 9
MAVIEKHVHEHFARLAAEGPKDETANTEAPHVNGTLQTPLPQVLEAPFAKVNSVATGSPAETAGLKAGDEIRNFGYVNHTNHDGLRRVGECVQGNEDVSWDCPVSNQTLTPKQRDVLVKVSRPSRDRRQELQLSLKPRRDWGGRGLLGCHIVPL